MSVVGRENPCGGVFSPTRGSPGDTPESPLRGSPFLGDTASGAVVGERASFPVSVAPEAARLERYRRMVSRWRTEEEDYLQNPQWVECRVILLLQEAFRPHCRRAKRALHSGGLSVAEYEAHLAEVRAALSNVKSEYRRTLQRLRESNASAKELASLATKAIMCVSLVYPWSSDGFVLSYAENLCFGQVTSPTLLNAKTSPSSSSSAPRPPTKLTSAPPTKARTGATPPAVVWPIRGTGGPRPALQALPIRKDTFSRSVAPDGSVVLSSAVARAPDALVALAGLSPPPPTAETYCGGAETARFASPLTTPGSPPKRLPPSVTGPILPEEVRLLERKQLAQTERFFCAHSLNAVSFVGLRRSTIAQQEVNARLAAARRMASRARSATDAFGPVGPLSPSLGSASETSSPLSEGSMGDGSPLSRLSRSGSLSDVSLGAELPPSCHCLDHVRPTRTTRRPCEAPDAPPTAICGTRVSSGAGRHEPRPMTPQLELVVKSLW